MVSPENITRPRYLSVPYHVDCVSSTSEQLRGLTTANSGIRGGCVGLRAYTDETRDDLIPSGDET